MNDEKKLLSVDEVLNDIQPHFLFNALNAILALCEQDPASAEKAIIYFSKFLRNNLNVIGRTNPIPFEQELDYVKSYVALEQICYPDKIQVNYSIQEKAFSIPAMTLVPLVKNCIRHGFKQDKSAITISTSTISRGEVCFVTIKDDGAGFDTSLLNTVTDPPKSIAVVKANLDRQCGASITVSSVVGEGTTVLLTVPMIN